MASTLKAAPSDAACDVAWAKIMRLAVDHGLVVQAYGGVATLATPGAQREQGVRAQVLRASMMREHGAPSGLFDAVQAVTP